MIAMPPLVPSSQWNPLSLAIARGDASQVRSLIETEKIDVNAFLDSSSWMPILMDVLLSNGFETEPDRIDLMRWLLEKGANPNICGRGGFNCLHIAVQQERYLSALDLMLDFNPDVNQTDADGSTIAYWAIQAFLLRKPTKDGQHALLRVIGKILSAGADLDRENRFGMTPRGWLRHAAPELKALVAQWEARKPVVRTPFTKQPVFPLNLQYPEMAQRIWSEHVPASGPAQTVQGELLRTVEHLRDDIKQNGNVNRKQNKRMAAFVRDTLLRSGVFDKTGSDRIRSGTDRLIRSSKPYLQDDLYDQLVDSVCLFCSQNEQPIPLMAKVK